jgi:hypothetical protein
MSNTLLTILTDEAARTAEAVEQLLMAEAQVAAPWVGDVS